MGLGERAGLCTDPTEFQWRAYEGTGETIELAFRDYNGHFFYDADFARPEVVGFGQIAGQGNTPKEIASVYPKEVTVEHHLEGSDPQYGGMDWRSLRLVLQEFEGTWYVVGIVHDEWTI